MTQDFHVLRCCECKIFQVHQVKKSNKWNCKVCGTKQSIKQSLDMIDKLKVYVSGLQGSKGDMHKCLTGLQTSKMLILDNGVVYGKGSGSECRQHVQKLNTHRGLQASHQDVTPSLLLPQNSECDDRNILNEPILPSYESNSSSKRSKWSKFVCKDHNESPANDHDEGHTIPAAGLSEVEALLKFECDEAKRYSNSSYPDVSAAQKMKSQKCINTTIQETAGKCFGSSIASNDQVRLNTVQKSFNCASEKSKWSNFVMPSDTNESGEKIICKKESKTSAQNVEHVKQTKNYTGFQFIMKASLKSGPP